MLEFTFSSFSLSIKIVGLIVLNAELKSRKSVLTIDFGLSRYSYKLFKSNKTASSTLLPLRYANWNGSKVCFLLR